MINEYGGDRNRWRCVEVDNGVCMLNGEGFIEQQGLKESQKWNNLGVMLSFISCSCLSYGRRRTLLLGSWDLPYLFSHYI